MERNRLQEKSRESVRIPGAYLVLPENILMWHEIVNGQQFAVQRSVVQAHGPNAAVVISGVIIDTLIRITAATIACDLATTAHIHTAAGHGNGIEQMEKLADTATLCL